MAKAVRKFFCEEAFDLMELTKAPPAERLHIGGLVENDAFLAVAVRPRACPRDNRPAMRTRRVAAKLARQTEGSVVDFCRRAALTPGALSAMILTSSSGVRPGRMLLFSRSASVST